LVKDKGGKAWTNEQAVQAAVFLSRIFIQHQLGVAERAFLPLTKTGLANSLGNPRLDLEELLRDSGLKGTAINQCIEELVSLGSELPLIKKLTAAVTHVAAEGRNVAQACRALGASNWSDVLVTVDSSVAIPYLCSSLFSPSGGRFSVGANAGVKALLKLNAKLVIQPVYVNEIAAHLLSAMDAPDDDVFASASELSSNGFVSHYFWLKNNGRDVPSTIREFINHLSPTAMKRHGDRKENARMVMPDIQRRLREYGIALEQIPFFKFGDPDYRIYKVPVDKQLDYYFESTSKRKSRALVNHDALVLAHHRKAIAELGESRICLTWDRSVISASKELTDCGWVITPVEASDLVVSTRIDGVKLTSLAHALAKTQISPSFIGSRLLDRVTEFAGAKLQDWQFKQKFTELFRRVTEHAMDQPDAIGWADIQLEEFLAEQGLSNADSEIETTEIES
jgi:hypothetical protein